MDTATRQVDHHCTTARPGRPGRLLGGAAVSAAVAAALLAASGTASAAPLSLTDCPLLLEGRFGTCVELLQVALNDTDGRYGLAEDGLFGAGTRIAVLDFQGRNGLPADGNAGPVTLQLLAQRTAESPAPAPITDAEVCQALGLLADGSGGCARPDSGAATSLGRPIGECVAEQFKSDILKEARKQRGILGRGVGVSKGLLKDIVKKATAVVTIPKCHIWDTDE